MCYLRQIHKFLKPAVPILLTLSLFFIGLILGLRCCQIKQHPLEFSLEAKRKNLDDFIMRRRKHVYRLSSSTEPRIECLLPQDGFHLLDVSSKGEYALLYRKDVDMTVKSENVELCILNIKSGTRKDLTQLANTDNRENYIPLIRRSRISDDASKCLLMLYKKGSMILRIFETESGKRVQRIVRSKVLPGVDFVDSDLLFVSLSNNGQPLLERLTDAGTEIVEIEAPESFPVHDSVFVPHREDPALLTSSFDTWPSNAGSIFLLRENRVLPIPGQLLSVFYPGSYACASHEKQGVFYLQFEFHYSEMVLAFDVNGRSMTKVFGGSGLFGGFFPVPVP